MPLRHRYKLFTTNGGDADRIELEDLRDVGTDGYIDLAFAGVAPVQMSPGECEGEGALKLTEGDARELIELLHTVLGDPADALPAGWLTLGEAAAYLGLEPAQVLELVDEVEIEARRIGAYRSDGENLVFAESDLNARLETMGVATPPARLDVAASGRPDGGAP